jgi:hypothetical protein
MKFGINRGSLETLFFFHGSVCRMPPVGSMPESPAQRQFLLRATTGTGVRPFQGTAATIHVVVGLTFDGPDIFRLLLERINVHHPAEDLWHELASSRIAGFLGRD